MPTGPTGTPPNAHNATTRERAVLTELYRAGEHADEPGDATAIRAGVALLVELIETRNRRVSNGFFDAPGADD